MKIKLIDVKREPQEVTFGTCELCMYTGFADEPVLIFEVDGKQIEVDGYYWDWGDYEEIPKVNVIVLAEYVSKIEFPEDVNLDYHLLEDMVYSCVSGEPAEKFEARYFNEL